MLNLSDRKFSLDEYFELEKKAEESLEFWGGRVWSVSGRTVLHERIVVNTGAHLRAQLRGRNCSVFLSKLKLKVPSFGPYRYADISSYCGEGEIEVIGGMEILTNPQLIVEVLSPETEAVERGLKFTYYKSIPSLNEYLLIATNRPHVTQFVKQNEAEWLQREAIGLDGKLTLNFGVELLLSEVYLDVEFPDPPNDLTLVER